MIKLYIIIYVITLLLLPLRLWIIKEKRSLKYILGYILFATIPPVGTALICTIYLIIIIYDLDDKYKISSKLNKIKIGFVKK